MGAPDPPVRQPKQARSADTLDRILDSARDLLDEKTFGELSIAEIMERAGMSVGSFYTRFRNKAALLPYLYERYDRELEIEMKPILEPSGWAALHMAERVARIVDLGVAMYRRNKGLWRAVLVHASSNPAIVSEVHRRRRRQLVRGLIALLLERREEIVHPHPEQAAEFALVLLFSTCKDQVLLEERSHGTRALSDKRLKEQLTYALSAYLSVAAVEALSVELTHHHALLAGYGTAMIGWLVLRPRLSNLWPEPEPATFAHPWREFGAALVAVACVLGMGQLYVRDLLLARDGAFGAAAQVANQVLLYGPMLALLALRRQPLSSAWLPTRRVLARVLIGLLLALSALTAFGAARGTLSQWPALVRSVYAPDHLHFAVHVLLEDITIAILFVRLAAALGRPRLTAIGIAALFAAGHIPGALAEGAGWAEIAPLMLDFVLGAGVLLVVRRSADVWWFWCVHFALDMTQFFTG